MPSVVRAATGTELPILSGLVVASLTFAAAVAVVALRKLSAENMFVLGTVALTTGVMLTLVGVESQNVGIMLFGTVVSGVGFGTVYSGTLRSLLPYALPGKRAGLLAAFFVEGYPARGSWPPSSSRGTFHSAFRRSRQASLHL